MATSRKKKQPEPEPEEQIPTHWYQLMLYQVRKASIQPPRTKAENIAYYESIYPALGKKGSWKQHIVADLAAITGIKPKNLEKRFDSQRRGNPEPRNAAQYKALGDLIGPRAPVNGYHVEFDGWIHFSHCEKRKFSVDITEEWAEEVAKLPELVEQAMLLIYMEEDDQDSSIADQQASIGICVQGSEDTVQDPKVEVTANQQSVQSGHSGRARRFSFFDRR